MEKKSDRGAELWCLIEVPQRGVSMETVAET